MTFNEFVINFLITTGLLGFILLLCKTWIIEKLKKGVEHDFDKKLESFKSDLTIERETAIEVLRQEFTRNREIQSLAASSFLAGQNSAFDRRLTAIEKLWDVIIQIGKARPVILIMADSLTKEDFQDIGVRSEMKKALEDLDLKEVTKFYKIFGGAEKTRPYVGEYLYSLSTAYNNFISGLVFELYMGKVSNNFKYWLDDRSVNTFLEKTLSEEEIEFMQKLKTGGINFVTTNIEKKIIEHSQKIISGEISALDGLDQAKKIFEGASLIKPNQET